ncbi:MAG: hypothetical protein B6244_00145 [Candidatus Cloacimonetes bacterium 4572_55]|nr:MAG: hypothetical protein B6244_00145 [Candidatus Cloacimonetes bacterium 4572_55]
MTTRKISTNFLIFLMLGLFALLPAIPVKAQLSDTVYVNTFDEDFYNWATPHVQTFLFPVGNRFYSEVNMYYTIGCPSYPGDCDPWDRLGYLWVVQDTVNYEIARIITPYDITGGNYPGECTWKIDVTAYQSVLRDSVVLRNYIESWIGGDDGWLITIDFEFIAESIRLAPYKVTNLWQSTWMPFGDPEDPIESRLAPLHVDIDAEADSILLRVITTGHGQGNTDNAAEFSRREHSISINGNTLSHYLWRSDCDQNPCSPQGGTWLYPRAGWCPGDRVIPWSLDATNYATPGQTAVIDYDIEPYENLCRPGNPDCEPGVTCPDCDYNYNGHTPPGYVVQSHLIYYKIPPMGQIEGVVTDGENVLAAALVRAEGDYSYVTLTDDNGAFVIPEVIVGEYRLTASIFGFQIVSTDLIEVVEDHVENIEIILPPLPLSALSGTVKDAYDHNIPPLDGAEIMLLDTPVEPTISDQEGRFSFLDLPIGTYRARATHPNYLPLEAEVEVMEGEELETIFRLIPIYTFEEHDHGFQGQGEWESGVPTSSGGPDQAYHGQRCWGTDLDDVYEGPISIYLTTPEYDLDASAPPYELSFYQWYQAVQTWDGGQVHISVDHGETWSLIDPVGGYPSPVVVALGITPGYSDHSDGWQFARFDLSDFAGQSAMFRFWFGGAEDQSDLGWFIDHVTVQGQNDIPSVSIEEDGQVVVSPAQYRLFQNHPNPFNPTTVIRFSIPESNTVAVTIYDATGRLVKTLIEDKMYPAGTHSLQWNGTGQNNESVVSGVYFYRLEAGNFAQAKRMTLLK